MGTGAALNDILEPQTATTMTFSTDTLINWMAGALLLVGLLAMATGLAGLRRPRAGTFFRQRRQAQMAALRNLVLGLGLFGLGLLVWVAGRPLVLALQPATPTAPPTPTATPVAVITPSPASPTIAPSDTLPPPPTATLTPAGPTPTPGPTGLPTLPADRLTPPGTLTVTPPAEAVIANLRLSRFNNCASQRGVAEAFTPTPKTLYALFDYDNWLTSAAWTNVWRYEGEIVLVETLLWDGSTGGCGFADYDNLGAPWRLGAYEVQVFIGAEWLGSASFTIQP